MEAEAEAARARVTRVLNSMIDVFEKRAGIGGSGSVYISLKTTFLFDGVSLGKLTGTVQLDTCPRMRRGGGLLTPEALALCR